MDTLFIPNEHDFRRWIKEAVKECINELPEKEAVQNPDEEPLLTRKEIAGLFRVSLVTINKWKKAGLPSHKQGGRVYFLRSEVIAYLKQKKGMKAQEYLDRERHSKRLYENYFRTGE